MRHSQYCSSACTDRESRWCFILCIYWTQRLVYQSTTFAGCAFDLVTLDMNAVVTGWNTISMWWSVALAKKQYMKYYLIEYIKNK